MKHVKTMDKEGAFLILLCTYCLYDWTLKTGFLLASFSMYFVIPLQKYIPNLIGVLNKNTELMPILLIC